MKDGFISEWTLDDSVYPRAFLPADSEVIALSLLNASSHQYAIVSKNPDDSLYLLHNHKDAWNLRAQLSLREGWIDQSVTGHHWVVLFENEATIVNLRTGETIAQKPPSEFSGKKVRIFGSDSAFFTYMEGHTIVMEDIQGTGTRHVSLESDSAIEHYAISPDQQTVAAAHADGTLRLWHAESGNLLLELLNQPWEDLAFSPKGTILFGYERSGALHYWDARSPP
jgi:WD40 repeat protein